MTWRFLYFFISVLLLDLFTWLQKFTLTKLIFLARLLILIKKGGLLQLKFGVVGVGVGVNIYLWAR